MALARIITRYAEDSQPLAEDLRARGFEVQTRSPEEPPSELADLEITLEECTPAEALMRASGVADRDVHVFIAPGAMTENARPMRVVPLIPKPGVITKPVLEPLSEPVFSMAQADGEPANATNDVELQAVEQPQAMVSQPEPVMPPQPEPAAIAISDLETQPEPVEDIAAMTSHSSEAQPETVLEQPQPEPIRIVQRVASHRTGVRGYRIAVERLSRNDKLFWRTAIGAGVATVAALLLVLSAPPSAPPPAGLVQSSGDIQRQVPSANPKRSAKVRARTRTFGTGSPALTKVETSTGKPAAAVKQPAPENTPGEAAESTQHVGNSEADVVAKDTVIRYGNPLATSIAPAQK
jgi:hypothetical protein